MQAINSSAKKWVRYLPPGVAAGEVVSAIGVISDTHTPRRFPDLPSQVGDIFAGVDLILHAGDVGKLWILDKLSQIGPVVAVHGNDEEAEATRELPYQQVVTIAGRRILLWHSHFPDRKEEMAFRKRDDSWERIFDRSVDRAAGSQASIVIYGHTHVPMVTRHRGVLLFNPGAIAAGTLWFRQTAVVALLFLMRDGTEIVQHVKLDQPDVPFAPNIDFSLGFWAGVTRFQTPFVDPIPALPPFRAYKEINRLNPMWQQIAGPYLWGNKKGEVMPLDIWLENIRAYDDLHPEDKALLIGHLEEQLGRS